jgi:hypothetical protein
VLEAVGCGVEAARLALARRLAGEIDDAGTAPYVRASCARVLADLLDRMQPEPGPAGVDVRKLLEEVVGNGRRN